MGQIDIRRFQIGNLDDVLFEVHEAMVADNFEIEPPVSDEMLDSIVGTDIRYRHTQRRITEFLIERYDYVHFLKNMNGLEYNGLIFYGIGESQYENSSPMNIIQINQDVFSDPDLIDENLRDKILIGEDSTSILTYNTRHDCYEIRDRIGTDYVEKEFSRFSELLQEEFNKVHLDPVEMEAHE